MHYTFKQVRMRAERLAGGKTFVIPTVMTVKRPDSLAAMELHQDLLVLDTFQHKAVPARARFKGGIHWIQRVKTCKNIYFQYVPVNCHRVQGSRLKISFHTQRITQISRMQHRGDKNRQDE